MTLYNNYIFDLYGTLIDIHTDESDQYLWAVLSDFYSRYGADYTPDELKNAYHRTVREELDENIRIKGIRYPDIKLENVFLRLFYEAEHKHKSELRFDRGEGTGIWTASVANLFRQLSMRRFGVFPGVRETLKTLKDRGARLYLLSNAQRVFSVPEIEKAGLYDFFDAIYISSDFGMAKPQPSFMMTLLNEQGLDPSQCVMIGNDRLNDMAIAKSCGVKGIFLNTDRHVDAELDEMTSAGEFDVIRSGNIEEIL